MQENIYILGNGKMAQAIALGLSNANYNYTYVVRRKGIDNSILYENFDISDKICILCFKPYNLNEISQKFLNKSAKIIISPLAGITLSKLSQIKAAHYLRIMPNIAAKYNKSCTTYIGDKNNKYHQKSLEIIQALGKVVECESENELDLAMAINGCAPAFLALVAEAISNGALSIGIKNDKAHELTSALFSSFESLIQNSHPANIKEDVCSPAGVSIKGVNVLENKAVRSAFIEAISKSAGI